MNDKKPLILISNDDGVRAKGLAALVDALSPLGDILVMAPDRARSGAACGITPHDPVRYKVVEERPGVKICACTGRPVDCVKLALDVVADRRPALVVSGVNHGDNSSVSVHYSGTMGVVVEGCMKGLPSVGFSLCDFDADADFSPAALYVRDISERVLREGLPHGVCLNVNFPKSEHFAGLRVCRMAHGMWVNEWEEAVHPHGHKYYWLTGSYVNLEPEETDTDAYALQHGYVAVTPVQVDMTAYGAMAGLKDLETL